MAGGEVVEKHSRWTTHLLIQKINLAKEEQSNPRTGSRKLHNFWYSMSCQNFCSFPGDDQVEKTDTNCPVFRNDCGILKRRLVGAKPGPDCRRLSSSHKCWFMLKRFPLRIKASMWEGKTNTLVRLEMGSFIYHKAPTNIRHGITRS